MNYAEAHKLATEQHPVRRPSWPADHHLRHHIEESISKLKMHTPEEEGSVEWNPGAEDEAAQDWEQYIPQQKPEKVKEDAEEQPEAEPKHKKK
jgi:hypothetical protein